MDWLKTILEQAVIVDGRLDVEATMKSVNEAFPKHAVSMADFNTKVKELKAANVTIENLKKEQGTNGELQKKIGEYETEISNLKAAAENSKKEYSLKKKMEEAGVLDPDYLIYKQGGLDKFTFDKEGKPVGMEETLKSYRESSPHLFKESSGYHPAGGGNPAVKNPFAKETFNLTEQGRMLKENPAQAKQLAAAAGVTL